jgi:hypothetical protein
MCEQESERAAMPNDFAVKLDAVEESRYGNGY